MVCVACVDQCCIEIGLWIVNMKVDLLRFHPQCTRRMFIYSIYMLLNDSPCVRRVVEWDLDQVKLTLGTSCGPGFLSVTIQPQSQRH
jgi:hypothetical protein